MLLKAVTATQHTPGKYANSEIAKYWHNSMDTGSYYWQLALMHDGLQGITITRPLFQKHQLVSTSNSTTITMKTMHNSIHFLLRAPR